MQTMDALQSGWITGNPEVIAGSVSGNTLVVTRPNSRHLGHLAKTQIDLNGSMSATARYHQLRITLGLSVIRSELSPSGSTVAFNSHNIPSAHLDDVSLELLRLAEQPIAVVHETICEQVHW
jgi:hypothetical protein